MNVPLLLRRVVALIGLAASKTRFEVVQLRRLYSSIVGDLHVPCLTLTSPSRVGDLACQASAAVASRHEQIPHLYFKHQGLP